MQLYLQIHVCNYKRALVSVELELFKVGSRGTDLQILTGWSVCHLGPERAPGDNPTSRGDLQICSTGLDLKQPKLYTLPGGSKENLRSQLVPQNFKGPLSCGMYHEN